MDRDHKIKLRKLLTVVFFWTSLATFAQNRSNVWELSYAYGPDVPGYEIKYQFGIMDTVSVFRSIPMWICSTNICDTSGNLLFFTNGNIIGNKNYDTLKNSKDFNPGAASNSATGVSYCQAALILPYPGSSDKYIIFAESAEYFEDQLQPLHLSYSIIDATLDGGLGGIPDSMKNKYAIEDTLSLGGLNAVKHANGRDWWIIVHRYNMAKYYIMLLTPNGIESITEQDIGSPIKIDAHVQSSFSSDGSKYCFASLSGVFEYMDFDRCDGIFSNLIVASLPDSIQLIGCSFSPSNRFLYVSGLYELYQLDTWNANMIADLIHIAEWDSFVDEFEVPVIFHMHQLGSDNKIYMAPWNNSKYMHVINFPDSIGLACDFEQHSYILPHEFNFCLPTFPNYDLSALEGSSCDTIVNIPTGLESSHTPSFRIAPNPVEDWLNVVYQSSEDVLFELHGANGQKMAVASLYHYFKNRLVNVSDLPPGVYLATVTQKGTSIWSEKVIVMH